MRQTPGIVLVLRAFGVYGIMSFHITPSVAQDTVPAKVLLRRTPFLRGKPQLS